MIRIALKGAMAHKARLALTAVAITLGVAFVAGTFVFSDTILARFETLFEDVYAGVDASVRTEEAPFGSDVTTEAGTLPDSLIADIDSLDEAAVAEGYIQSFGQVIDPNGDPVGVMGAPTYVYSWIAESELNPFTIHDGNGRAPEPGELVLDITTAEKAGVSLGEDVDVQFGTGVETFRLVGLASFGESNNLAGATISVITLGDAQRILDMPGVVNIIDVIAAGGVDQDTLVASIEPVLPVGAEAVTGDQQVTEQIDGFTENIGFLSIALLGFAGVAVLVGAFIISNTFRIVVAQRTKELSLLRAIGASSRQVVGVVLIEALAVGLLASIVGVFAGIGVAELLKAGMNAVGFGPPDGPMTVELRTVVVSMTVGVVVTLASALLPALQASRVAPVAAMRAHDSGAADRSMRVWARLAALVIGVAIVAVGIMGDQLLVIAAGAVVAVAGTLLLAPLLTRPIAAIVGRMLPGITGRLARDNAGRDPRRTSTTASALTIGLALVVFTAIFAASTKDSITATFEESFPADLSVQSSNLYMPVSFEAVGAIEADDAVAVSSAVRMGPARVDGTETTVTAIEAATIDTVYRADASLDIADLGDGLLVEETTLEAEALAIGDTVTIEFPTGTSENLTVIGTHDGAALGDYVIESATWSSMGGADSAFMVLVALRDGVDPATGKEAVEATLADFPTLSVSTTSDQIEAAEAQIDAFLVLFTGLLGLALIIAVLGIANTLALSVVERTREIGLLRAVGMSRSQVRWMITDESVVTALFGAIVGSALGLALGWVVVAAFSAEGLSTFSIPVAQIAIWLGVAALAGVVAAILPARRASRLDVLQAISYA